MRANGFAFLNDHALAFFSEEETKTGDKKLRAILSGEERDGVVVREDGVIDRRQRQLELLRRRLEMPGDPVVLRGRRLSGDG